MNPRIVITVFAIYLCIVTLVIAKITVRNVADSSSPQTLHANR